MPWSLKRYNYTDALNFITFSCYQRKPSLSAPERRDLFLDMIEKMRLKYRFAVCGYVVMPEHVHLLVSEPEIANCSVVIRAIKIAVVRRKFGVTHSSQSQGEGGHPRSILYPDPFWTKRFYDFNVYSDRKFIEKLRYIHRNPVKRGLVARPEDWKWSSFRSYATGEVGPVKINDWSWKEEKLRLKVV
jgi:putative transposase